MAAAPGEDLTPLAAPVLLPATPAAGWSSLPGDLVRRIADSFLATNDVDCYVDLRAVCSSWRAATDDPKSNSWEPRFQPRQWAILDESGTTRRFLLVNTATGRFLQRELGPLLRDYFVVATTALGGFLVLADRSPPHAARVLNPLTGGIIRFAAHMPVQAEVAAALSFDPTSSSPAMLTLFCDSCCKIYTVFPHHSVTLDNEQSAYSYFRRAAGGATDGRWWALAGADDVRVVLCKIRDAMVLLNVYPFKLFSGDPPEVGLALADGARCFLMKFCGQLLIIIKLQQLVQVFKYQAGSDELVPMKSIGNHAIFIGPHRCLAVDADMFPSVEANCVYYTEHVCLSARICKCDIKDSKAESISEGFDFVKRDSQFVLVADRPFTIIQLLSRYTINIQRSELALQQITEGADKLDD